MTETEKKQVWIGWHEVMTTVPPELNDEADRRRARTRAQEEQALKRLEAVNEKLACGEPMRTHGHEQVVDLLRKISPKRGMEARQAVADWLARGLARGCVELGWDIPAPPDIVRLPRERSLISESAWLDAPTFMALEQAFINNLGAGTTLTELEQVGRLLHSAIACGGLWAPQKHQMFEASLVGEWRCDGLRVYLSSEFQLRIDETSNGANRANCVRDGQLQRWQADALTGRLLDLYVRGRDPATKLLPDRAERCLRAYWRHLQIARPDQPRSVAEFIRMAITRWTPYLFPFLIEIARGREVTADVPGPALARLRTGKPVKYMPRSETGPELTDMAAQMNVAPDDSGTYRELRAQYWFVLRAGRELVKLGRKPSRDAIRETLENAVKHSDGTPSRIELLLIGWLSDLAINGGLSGGRLTASSLKRYFGAARYALLAAFQDVNLADLDSGGWALRLQQAIDRARDRMTPRQVVSFASYLLRCPDGPRFDIEELEVEDESVRVRATLVSPGELERALRRLHGDSRLVEMQEHASMLMFYCGLRPDDIVHFRLCDVHGFAKPEFLVRPHSDYDPKSLSSVRRVPVMTQLPPVRAKQFAAWVRRRVAEAGTEDSDDLLLAMAGAPRKELTADFLQGPVTRALREETGDHSITFYSLRHSFATIGLLRHLAADTPRLLPQGYAIFREECFQPESCRAFKSALGADPNAVSASGLRMIASNMGHLNVHTTQKHYIHLMDLILAQMFDLAIGRQFPEAVFKALSDTGSYWYEHRKDLYLKSESSWDLEQLGRLWLRGTSIASETHEPHRRPRVSKRTDAGVSIASRLPYGLLPSVLHQLFKIKQSPEMIAASLGLPRPLVEKVATRALALCAVTASDGDLPGQEKWPSVDRLTPPAPRLHRDQDDAREIQRALEKRQLKRSTMSWLMEIGKNNEPGNLMTARFNAPDTLGRLVDVYQQLGIPRKRLFLILDPHQDASADDEMRRKDYWSEESGIPFDRIKVEARSSRWWRHAPPDAPQGYVMLYVLPKETQSDPKSGKVSLVRSYGVRYAMHLALLNEPD